MKELNRAIGGRIRTYRESIGLNRELFSERIGLSPQFLAEVENGKKGLSAESIFKICTQCEMSADYLVLGKTNSDELKTPLNNLIEEIPWDYSVQCVQIMKSISDIISNAEKSAKGQKNTENISQRKGEDM